MSKKFEISNLFFALIMAIFLELFLDIIAYRIYVKEEILSHMFIGGLFYFVIIAICSFSKYLAKSVAFILLMVCFFYDYYVILSYNPGFKLNAVVLAFVLDTNVGEATEFLSSLSGLTSFFFIHIFIPLLFIIFYPWNKKWTFLIKKSKNGLFYFILFYFILFYL